MTPDTIIVLALVALALTRVWGKPEPVWRQHLNSWRTILGWVAVIAALLIVMNPEFYALGLLSDSTFFDLLVLALGLQLQTVLARVWRHGQAGISAVLGFANFRLCTSYAILLLLFAGPVSIIQKVVHRLSS